MIDPYFVFLGAAIGLVGSVLYAVATIRGRASPNRVTFLLWAAAPLIGFFAQLDAGVGLPSVQTLSAGVGPLIVLIASFVSRHSSVRVSLFDVVCGVVAAAAVAVWLGLGNAPLAVLFAVLADLAGAVPTIRKAWVDPDSENAFFYALIGVNAGITLLTLTDWQLKSWSFAGYILLLSLTQIAIIALRRSRRTGRVVAASASPSDTAPSTSRAPAPSRSSSPSRSRPPSRSPSPERRPDGKQHTDI